MQSISVFHIFLDMRVRHLAVLKVQRRRQQAVCLISSLCGFPIFGICKTLEHLTSKRHTLCSASSDDWETELLRLLPLLCNASSSLGGHASSSLSIIVLVMQHYLTPLDWLPCLQSNLEITAMLQGAFQLLADATGKPSNVGLLN